MITVYCVHVDADEFYGTSMDDVRWFLGAKASEWLGRSPVTVRVRKTYMSKAEFVALPEWGA